MILTFLTVWLFMVPQRKSYFRCIRYPYDRKLTKRRPRSVVFSLTIALSRSPLRHFPTSESSVINHASCVMHHLFIFADEIIQWSCCSPTTSLIVIAVRKVEEDTAHGVEIQYNFIKMGSQSRLCHHHHYKIVSRICFENLLFTSLLTV